jgi:hypothetical protein
MNVLAFNGTLDVLSRHRGFSICLCPPFFFHARELLHKAHQRYVVPRVRKSCVTPERANHLKKKIHNIIANRK